MSSSTFNADEEALRAELRKKERDLLLAARYGKGLLEENERIKKDLENVRQEHANAMELLETQRRESQRSLTESRQTAEQHISEMEQQLADLKNELTAERATISSLREEHLRSMEELRAENLQLREGLAAKTNQELEGERSQHNVAELNKRLGEGEKEIQRLTLESTELQKQLEIVQESNKTLSMDLSTLADSCDQLTTELVTCREEVEYWEKKYKDKDKQLDTCSKDLDDSQELLNQLQIELEQQSTCTPKSGRSGSQSASLYDELCSSRDSLSYMGLMQSEDLSSTCGSDEAEREEDTATANVGIHVHSSSPNLLHRQSTLVLPEKCSQSIRCGWVESDVFICQRCQELKKKLASSEEELKWVNEQLLMAVQQKFKLQQQIEDWQTDMTQVVEQQIQRKLIKGAPRNSVKRTNTKSKSKKPDQPVERQVSYHMIKDSMVF